MSEPADVPLEYRLEHLQRELADDVAIAETDVVLEAHGEQLVVRAHVPTDVRRDALLAAVRSSWEGPVTDEVEVLTHLDDRDRPAR